LYPGVQTVAEPELPLFPDTVRDLSWKRPGTWWRAGRSIATSADAVVFVVVTPLQLPAYMVVARSCRRHRRRLIAVCHNVLPHEPRRGDRMLTRRFLSGMDSVLVHSETERDRAESLVSRPTAVAALPYFFPKLPPVASAPDEGRTLLFLGFIRPYKGLDVLLESVARSVSRPRLLVAGECWVDADDLRRRAALLGLEDRVTFRFGYVSMRDIPGLMASADAIVLPYLSGTGSQYPRMARAFGRPAIVTRVGDLPDQVQDGVDGFVCAPASVEALADAIDSLYEPGMLARLAAGIAPPDPQSDWDLYLEVLEAGVDPPKHT
jgi:glycosyltransferase involved in cell wall biosynthesis